MQRHSLWSFNSPLSPNTSTHSYFSPTSSIGPYTSSHLAVPHPTHPRISSSPYTTTHKHVLFLIIHHHQIPTPSIPHTSTLSFPLHTSLIYLQHTILTPSPFLSTHLQHPTHFQHIPTLPHFPSFSTHCWDEIMKNKTHYNCSLITFQ